MAIDSFRRCSLSSPGVPLILSMVSKIALVSTYGISATLSVVLPSSMVPSRVNFYPARLTRPPIALGIVMSSND